MQPGKLNIQKIEIEPFAFIHDFQTRTFVQYAAIVEKSENGRSVVKMLSEDRRVIDLQGKMISRGSGTQSFEIKILAMWFLWCTNEYSPEMARSHLDSFLDSEEISVLNALWVLGIKVEHPLILNDGYTIQPLNQMRRLQCFPETDQNDK